MQLSEKEIENFIFDDLVQNSGTTLHDRGLSIYNVSPLLTCQNSKWLRQFNLGPYGICDIIGYCRSSGRIYIDLIELKSVPLQCNDFEQILRYERGILRYLSKIKKSIIISKYLIGPFFKEGHYISNHVGVSVVEYSYGLDGIYFNQHDEDPLWAEKSDKNFNFIKSLQNAEKVHGYR